MGKRHIFTPEVSYSNSSPQSFNLDLVPHIISIKTYFSPVKKIETHIPNAKGTIPTPPQAQIVEETQALSLGNICIVDGSWTSTDQFSGIGWVWKDSMENVQLMETRNLRRREQHYTRNWKR